MIPSEKTCISFQYRRQNISQGDHSRRTAILVSSFCDGDFFVDFDVAVLDEMSSLLTPGTIGELPSEADLGPFAELLTSSCHCIAFKFSHIV